MKYGTYNISLSIGYSGADQEDALDISDHLSESDWDNLTEEEQAEWLDDMTKETLGQYIEYGCKFVK